MSATDSPHQASLHSPPTDSPTIRAPKTSGGATPNRFNYYQNNPFLGRLLGNLGPLRQAARLFLVFTACYLLIIPVCEFENCRVIPGIDAGLVEDLLNPALMLALVWMCLANHRMLDLLEKSLMSLPRMVHAPPDEVTREAEAIRDFIGIRSPAGRIWHRVTVIFFAVLVLGFQGWGPLFAPAKGATWAVLPYDYPLAYAVGVLLALLIWVVLAANFTWYAMATAFRFFIVIYRSARAGRLVVLPLSPDGKAGLAVIGDLTFAVVFVLGGMLVPTIAYMVLFGLDWPVGIALGIYLVILSAGFTIPITFTHLAMQQVRHRELGRLAGAFYGVYRSLPPADPAASVEAAPVLELDTQRKFEVLCRLEQLYSRAESIPVWPVRFQTLSQFISLIGIPILLVILQSFIDKVL